MNTNQRPIVNCSTNGYILNWAYCVFMLSFACVFSTTLIVPISLHAYKHFTSNYAVPAIEFRGRIRKGYSLCYVILSE